MIAEEFLKDLFYEGVRAVHPQRCLEGRLPSLPDNGRVIVIGAGKSAAAMAKTVEDQWGDRGGRHPLWSWTRVSFYRSDRIRFQTAIASWKNF